MVQPGIVLTPGHNGTLRRGKLTKTALVVVGMHRSGTSLATRILNGLGAELPSDLIGPALPNPDGYWESAGLVRIHNEMLAAIGSSWHDLRYLPPFWEDEQFVQPYRARIIEALKTSFRNANFFVVKDPRISRFVPLMQDALSELGAQAKFIIVVRNPLEVAASLEKRDQFGWSKSALLWLDHNLRAERSTRRFQRMFVLYDDLLADWRHVIQAARENLGINLAGDESKIELVVKPELRNHAFSARGAWPEDGAVDWVKAAFEAIRSLAQKIPGNQRAELDRIYCEFVAGQRAFGQLLVSSEYYTSKIKVLSDDADKLRDQRAAIFSSHSWRITAPLRAISHRLKLARRSRSQ